MRNNEKENVNMSSKETTNILNGWQSQETCLLCNPEAHGLANQILLRSDHFSLLAGSKPAMEGYIIIAPHRCDQPNRPFCSFANIPMELLDEVAFLRCLVSEFYRDAYHQEASMHFEYGQSPDCLPNSDEHKYNVHASLSCYPYSFPLLEGLRDFEVKGIEGFADLREMTGGRPYLLVENSLIDESVPADAAIREKWISKIALLETHSRIPIEYLDGLLKAQLEKTSPAKKSLTSRVDLVGNLVKGFQNWLQSTNKYTQNLLINKNI